MHTPGDMMVNMTIYSMCGHTNTYLGTLRSYASKHDLKNEISLHDLLVTYTHNVLCHAPDWNMLTTWPLLAAALPVWNPCIKNYERAKASHVHRTRNTEIRHRQTHTCTHTHTLAGTHTHTHTHTGTHTHTHTHRYRGIQGCISGQEKGIERERYSNKQNIQRESRKREWIIRKMAWNRAQCDIKT